MSRRFGDNESVLCARRGQRVVALKSFGRVDLMRVAGETALMARELGAEAIFVDEGGLGGGVVDRLRELKAPVHGVQFGRKAPHPTRFANYRSEIFWELRRLLNDRLIALPDNEEIGRATPLVALRRLQLRPGVDAEQARVAEEESSRRPTAPTRWLSRS